MFSNCTSLQSAPELPATSMAESCYAGMFSNCTSLQKAPELSATTIAESCYAGMFSDCTSLQKAPELSATTIAESCYAGMFSNCTNLRIAPVLPAIRLYTSCYEKMFSNCTSLQEMPELPASFMATACYAGMFSGCTGLTKIDKMCAKICGFAIDKCFEEMFKDCNNLCNIHVYFEKWDTTVVYYGSTVKYTYTDSWVHNVSKTGTFVCPSNLPKRYGENYIPEGWNVTSYYMLNNLSPDDIVLSATSAIPDEKITISVSQKEGHTPILFINNRTIPMQGSKYEYTMENKDVDIKVEYKNKFPNSLIGKILVLKKKK
jgi:hypothetical protein